MCFARTYHAFETIETEIRRCMPFENYHSACMHISCIASHALARLDIAAVPELVGLWKPATREWIGHWVLISDGQILDFKRRLFLDRPDIGCSAQEDGWYPRGRTYKRNPTIADFKKARGVRKLYVQFLTMDLGEVAKSDVVVDCETKMFQ